MNEYLTPVQAVELSRLNLLGQRFYAEARAEGTDHGTAFADAVHCYGRRS